MLINKIQIKIRTISRPIKYALLFIIIHWAILFPIAYTIDGHPPIPLLILILPSIIANTIVGLFINLIIPKAFLLRTSLFDYLLYIVMIPTNTAFYGLLGYLYGRRKKIAIGEGT